MNPAAPSLPCPACDSGRISLASAFTRCFQCIVAGRLAERTKHLEIIRAQFNYKRDHSEPKNP